MNVMGFAPFLTNERWILLLFGDVTGIHEKQNWMKPLQKGLHQAQSPKALIRMREGGVLATVKDQQVEKRAHTKQVSLTA